MESNGINLRPLKSDDAYRMLEWMRNDDVTYYLNIGGKDTKLETVLRFIESAADESENLHRAIVDENDKYLGTISLKHIDREKEEAEYAIAMHMDAMGTGAARAATEQILRYAFGILGLDRVILCVQEDNRRAVRFYNKCRFKLIPCPGYGEYINTGLMWFEQIGADSHR